MYLQIAAAVGLAAIIGMGIWHYESKITALQATEKGLRDELAIANSSLVVKQANVVTLHATIKDMNLATEKLAVKHEQVIAKYETYKNQPDKVRYQTLYKYVDQGGSNECEDIKSAIDGVSRYINDGMR